MQGTGSTVDLRWVWHPTGLRAPASAGFPLSPLNNLPQTPARFFIFDTFQLSYIRRLWQIQIVDKCIHVSFLCRMSHSPSPDEQVSLSAESWVYENLPVKCKIKSVVQCPPKREEPPMGTSSPKAQHTSRRDASPQKGKKCATSESVAWWESSCPSKKGKKLCPFCNTLLNHPLRCHAFHNHVPAISDLMKICCACGEICFQASQIKRHLSGPCQGGHYLGNVKKWALLVLEIFCCILAELKLTTWEILLQYMAKHPEILPKETSPTPNDIQMMNAFHQYCGVPHPEMYSFSPPNTLTGALHWRILGNLQRISQGARECLPQLHEKPFRGGSTRTPMATVSIPPQPQPVVPMALPAPSKSQESRQQVVPLALPAPPPRPQQWPALQNLAVQPVAPLVLPIPCYGMANPLRMLPASSRY